MIEKTQSSLATFTAILHWEDDVWVAECPEVGTVSQGDTIDEALAMLREATELFLEDSPSPQVTQRFVTSFTLTIETAHA